MSKFNVTLTKRIAIVVEADTEGEAREQAVSELEDYPDRLDWEVLHVIPVGEA